MTALDSYAREGAPAPCAHLGENERPGEAPEIPHGISAKRANDAASFVDRYGRDPAACRANAERAQEIGGEVGRLWNLLSADHVLLGREVAKKVTQLSRLELVCRAMGTVSERDLEWADALEELAAWDEARHTDSKPVGMQADRQALTVERLAK